MQLEKLTPGHVYKCRQPLLVKNGNILFVVGKYKLKWK